MLLLLRVIVDCGCCTLFFFQNRVFVSKIKRTLQQHTTTYVSECTRKQIPKKEVLYTMRNNRETLRSRFVTPVENVIRVIFGYVREYKTNVYFHRMHV